MSACLPGTVLKLGENIWGHALTGELPFSSEIPSDEYIFAGFILGAVVSCQKPT